MALDLKVRQAPSLSLNGTRQAGSLSYLHDAPEASDIVLTPCRSPDELTNAAFHLQLDEAVHFDCVLHRQFFDERLDKARHDHR